MKKYQKLLILSLLALSSCGTTMTNEKYEDVTLLKEDKEFTFQTNLEKDVLDYPLSKGRKIYVSNEGDDSNDGLSENKPIKTINKVNSLSLQAGDNILFKKGETFTGALSFTSLSGDDNNPITFASYGDGSKPIITNKFSNVFSVEKGSNIVVRDLKFIGENKKRDETTTCYNIISFSYSFVKENKYKNIYICDNEVEGNGTDSMLMGITVTSTEDNYKSSPINVLDNCIIRRNKVSNIGRSGIHSGGWLNNQPINQNEGHVNKYTNFHFDSNEVHDVGCIGIYIMDCTDSTINRNLVYNTGMYNVNQVMEGECGIMALCDINCDIMFNEVYNCFDQKTGFDAMGIDIDWNTDNIRVQYNYCHDNQGGGIGTMANQNSFILNNKVENNQGDTNNKGAITVSNFTSRYEAVREDWHAVKNLKIKDNLILHNNQDTHAFQVKNSNGDTNFEGNEFTDNHLIYNGEKAKNFYWINVDSSTPWYKFANNKFYSDDNSQFRAFESTDYFSLNNEEGATPYEPTKEKSFSEWQKRDLNSTYELLDSTLIAANPYDANIKYEDEKLIFNWKVNTGDIWHFNLYELQENETPSYLNMIGESYTNEFTYTPNKGGTFYYVIQPESNQGSYGKAIKLKVNL